MNRPLYHNISNDLEEALTPRNKDTEEHRIVQLSQKLNIPKIEHHTSWHDIVSRHIFGHELRRHINMYKKYIKSSKERYQNFITHNFEEYREHFYTTINFNKDDVVLLNDGSIAHLNQNLEKGKDYDIILVRYSDHHAFTIHKKDIVVIIPKKEFSGNLYKFLENTMDNYKYLGGTNKYLNIKNSLGKQIRKKIYIIDNKEKVRIKAHKYVSINTYKKNYLS
jgi:hypothetical protein